MSDTPMRSLATKFTVDGADLGSGGCPPVSVRTTAITATKHATHPR